MEIDKSNKLDKIDLYIYSSNNRFNHKISNEYNIHIFNDSDINEIFIKKIHILIIGENNEYLLNLTKKFKIIVFTNIFKYINDLEYVYYANDDELNKYLKILFNNMDKTFTIIVPIYNTYKYLDKCVSSILKQTFKNYKIILCDDYSNIDDYIKFKTKYSKIKNLFMTRNDNNNGKFLTINMCLNKINTDYFLILDSDDKLIKNRLFYDLINLNNQEYGDIYCVQSKYIRFDIDKKNIIENDYGHNSITFKTNIIRLIGYYCPNRFGSDTEYIMRIKKILGTNSILKYNKITYIAIKRIDNSNLTNIYNVKLRRIFINKVINIHKNITNVEKLFDIKTDYFVDLVKHKKDNELVLKEYKKFYLDIENLSDNQIIEHWKNKGINEGRLPNLSIFYYYYPNFNWKLYQTNHNFLNDIYKVYGWVYLKNKENYIEWLTNNNFIKKQNENLNTNISRTNITRTNFKDYIMENNIKYICVSQALEHFESRICNKFDLIRYNKLTDKFENVIFFGLYNKYDYIKITNHIGKKFLMWGGTDSNIKYEFRRNIMNKIKNYYDIINLSISANIDNSLTNSEISFIPIYLNMVNEDIFKPLDKFGKSIYIYNGFTKGNEEIYGKNIYQELVNKIPEYNYIYSNELNIPYEQMPEIYAKCFIGLRLTEHDGNANTVQEFNSMNIPIIFNGTGGIAWNNLDDIIRIIKTYNNSINE